MREIPFGIEKNCSFLDCGSESLGSMYCVLGTMRRKQRTTVFFLAWQPNERHVVSQTTRGPMILFVLHSRSHRRALVLVFPKFYCFRKNDTVFLFFNQTNFSFFHLFLHILLDIINAFPMASSAMNSIISNKNIRTLSHSWSSSTRLRRRWRHFKISSTLGKNLWTPSTAM